MDLCICCGTPLGSNRAKEHVIPAWLQKALGERYEDLTRCIADSLSEQIVGRRQHVFDRFQQGNVCEKCNNGWMMELEDQTAPVLTPLMNAERNPFEISASETFLISRWAAKTALVLSSVTMDDSSKDLSGLLHLRDVPDCLPERWGVFVGVQPSRNRNFSYYDRHHWPSVPADKAKPSGSLLQHRAISFQTLATA